MKAAATPNVGDIRLLRMARRRARGTSCRVWNAAISSDGSPGKSRTRLFATNASELTHTPVGCLTPCQI